MNGLKNLTMLKLGESYGDMFIHWLNLVTIVDFFFGCVNSEDTGLLFE